MKFKKIIDNSKISYNEIKNIYYFQSKRWDLELENNILLKLPKNNIKNSLERWYRLRCYLLLEERLNYYSKKINLSYNSFSVCSFKKRLGSCDNKKHLSFNWKIILMPKQIIDYIIIHELCHIIHFNHSTKN